MTNERWTDREARDAQILRLHEQKLSAQRIARLMEMSPATVTLVLTGAQVERLPNSQLGARKKLRLSDQEIAERYRHGVPITDLARQCGTKNVSTVRQRLYDQGVPERVQYPNAVGLPEAEIVEAYDNFATIKGLAKQHRVNPLTIRKLLLRNNVTIRKKGPVPRAVRKAATAGS